MNKDKILKEIAAATAAGNIEEILALTKLLNAETTTSNVAVETEPVKRKRGRPKKIEQKEVIVEDEPEIEDDEDLEEEIEYEVEDDDDEPIKPKKTKPKKVDKFLAQFEIKQKLKTDSDKNTGVQLSWKKPAKIEFLDETEKYREDVLIDKKLKVAENVPRDRPKVTKKKVPCCICGEKFSTYSNNIHYMYDEEKRKTVIVPMRCNNCYGEK